MIPILQQHRWLGRLAFLAGNVAGGFLIAFAGILPVRDFLAARDQEIVQQRTMLARFRAVAGHETAVQSAANGAAADLGEFLVGKSEGVINADLQTRLKRMAGSAGAQLRSVRSLPAQGDEQTRYVGSRIELFGSLAAIHRAVHAIESAKPYLFVKAGSIRLSPPVGQTGVPREPIIAARLDIFAAVQVEVEE